MYQKLGNLMTLEGHLPQEEITQRLQKVIMKDSFFIRFRSLAIDGNFIFVPDFDASQHVTVHPLEKKEDGSIHSSPHEFASKIINVPFLPTRPQWHLYLLYDEENNHNKTYAILKVHHVVGDGASIARAIFKISDDEAKFDQLLKDKSHLYHEYMATRRPNSLKGYFHLAMEILFACWAAFKIIGKLLFRPEPRTILKKPGSLHKRLASTTNYSVEEIKTVGKPFDATLNDVMLCCISGAMLQAMKASTNTKPSEKLVLRCAMPVNVRLPVDPISECRNRWATLLIDLPVGQENPIERLKQIRQTTQTVKQPLTKFFFFYLTQALLLGSKRFLQFLFPYFTNRWSIAISNVYGKKSIPSLEDLY